MLFSLWGFTLLSREWMPFLQGLSAAPLVFVALLFATTLTVNSPMVTLALLTETKATGPLAKTTLGVVLVADVAVILLFTAAFSLAQASLGGATAGAGVILWRLLREVLGSILAGALVGGVVSLYLRFVKRELVVFAVVVVFATAARGAGSRLRAAAESAGGGVSGRERGAGARGAAGGYPPSDGGPGLRRLLRDGGSRAQNSGVCGGLAVVLAVVVVRVVRSIWGRRVGARLAGAGAGGPRVWLDGAGLPGRAPRLGWPASWPIGCRWLDWRCRR